MDSHYGQVIDGVLQVIGKVEAVYVETRSSFVQTVDHDLIGIML